MTDEIRAFLLAALTEMKYDVSDVDDDTVFGPAGLDVDSLGLAELAVRVEDRFAVAFDDEAEDLAMMTVGEFSRAVAARIAPASAH
ncbi:MULTISPECIES: acyl carrier protein [unclassified Micromonospora]|uniref:acyl carrier protein n=1 Tax=unclassified Micromonospora TaxID=2617518 RepID=UPI001C226CA6|nr:MULTISPECIES: acyl carrier protein [unclassified Micromonospora]MBU8861418.1 acyl carrier protein [Micromonospora sp. WMMB482]MDM4780980.1 acyl carrier protein [Micromonospora sp. b486]